MTPLPDTDPVMITVNAVWTKTTRAQREAFHNVCCNNSRDRLDLLLFSQIASAIQNALRAKNQ